MSEKRCRVFALFRRLLFPEEQYSNHFNWMTTTIIMAIIAYTIVIVCRLVLGLLDQVTAVTAPELPHEPSPANVGVSYRRLRLAEQLLGCETCRICDSM